MVCFSAHITGSAFSYEVLSINPALNLSKVKVNLRLYREVTGGGADFDNNAYLAVFVKNSLGNYEIYNKIKANPENRTTIIVSYSAENCEAINESVVEKADYVAIFDLSLDHDDYIFAYQRCCRSDDITNIISPGAIGLASTLNLRKKAIDHIHKGLLQKTDFEREIIVNQFSTVDLVTILKMI